MEKYTVAAPLPATAQTTAGGSGAVAIGVTALDGSESIEVPTMLVAETTKS